MDSRFLQATESTNKCLTSLQLLTKQAAVRWISGSVGARPISLVATQQARDDHSGKCSYLNAGNQLKGKHIDPEICCAKRVNMDCQVEIGCVKVELDCNHDKCPIVNC